MSTARVTLDNPVFSGRLRQYGRGTPFIHEPAKVQPPAYSPAGMSDVYAAPKKVRSEAQPVAVQPRQERSQVLQRNIIAAPEVSKVKTKTKKSGGQKLLLAMASIVFVVGMGVAYIGLRTNQEVIAQTKEGTSSNNAATARTPVSEEKPSAAAMAAYKVDPTLPRYIRIAKLNVFARVQAQGTEANGALKAPYNVHDAGWYQDSGKPGEGGAMLLDGHVAGPTVHGVFYDIKKLTKGDLLEVERGDGKKFTYKVVTSKTSKVKDVDMSAGLLPIVEGKSGLNLITCTGNYDYKSGEYDSRIMVFAVEV